MDSYARPARSELDRWRGWLDKRRYDVAVFQKDGDAIIRRYAQGLI